MAPLSVPAHKMAPGLTASSKASAVTPLVTPPLELAARLSPRLTRRNAEAATAATPGEFRMEEEGAGEPLGGGVAALMATILSLGPQDLPVDTLKMLMKPGMEMVEG